MWQKGQSGNPRGRPRKTLPAGGDPGDILKKLLEKLADLRVKRPDLQLPDIGLDLRVPGTLARSFDPLLDLVLLEIATSAPDAKSRLEAVRILKDRGFGRPPVQAGSAVDEDDSAKILADKDAELGRVRGLTWGQSR